MPHSFDNTQLRIRNVVGDILAASQFDQLILLAMENDGGAGDASEQWAAITVGDEGTELASDALGTETAVVFQAEHDLQVFRRSRVARAGDCLETRDGVIDNGLSFKCRGQRSKKRQGGCRSNLAGRIAASLDLFLFVTARRRQCYRKSQSYPPNMKSDKSVSPGFIRPWSWPPLSIAKWPARRVRSSKQRSRHGRCVQSPTTM